MATYLTAFSETKTALEWSRDARCQVCLMTLLKRLRSGWDPLQALTAFSTARTDRHRIIVEAFGISKPLIEWELDPRMKVSPEVFIARFQDGWGAERALAEDSEEPKSRARSPQKLYHGKPLTFWLRDPRCLVSRATLVRNFEMNLPLEEALQFRIQNRGEEPLLVADTVKKALELMASGGEIWQYQEFAHKRISLIVGNERYDLSDDVFSDLTSLGHVDSCYSSKNLTMYQLKSRSLR